MTRVNDMQRTDDEEIWSEGARAIISLAITAAAVTLAVCLRQHAFFQGGYFWTNRLEDETTRDSLIGFVFGVGVLAAVSGSAFLLLKRKEPSTGARLSFFAARVGPLGPLACFPLLFSWKIYEGHDIAFLLLVLLVALAIGATLERAVRAGLTEPELRLWSKIRGDHATPRASNDERIDRYSMAVVLLAIAAYIAYFSYYTVVWHRSSRSGYDLAIENNILWNLLHGGPFFHASPTLGPTGSHFGRHATLISYLLLPFYALHQSAETLHVLESVLIGLGALPLFLFAKRRVGSLAAATIAVAYLFHPAVQESNLFEMHYVKLGIVFFWTALWLLDEGRTTLGLVAAGLTLAVREDVATWVVLLGLFILLSDETRTQRKVGILITAVASAYVVVVKFIVMPSLLHGGDDLLFMYTGLIPEGRRSFAWVLATVFGNPAFTLESLLDLGKLRYLLQLMVPLAFIPFRKKIGLFALIPGILYCFLSTNYAALIDIHYQYSPHVLAFEFPALVLVAEGAMRRAAASDGQSPSRGLALMLVTLMAATLPCSYQYGAVLQQNTSRGGPLPFKFGWDDEGRARQRSIERLSAVVPPTARVASSALTLTQFSSRPNDYSLSLSLYDADWIVAPTRASEYVGEELPRTMDELRSGRFGVVVIDGPFFAARRGQSTELNQELMRQLAQR